MNYEKYYSIKKAADILGLTTQTLRNWDISGKLEPHHKSPHGDRYYSESQINSLLQMQHNNVKERKIIGYCRVSSKKQQDDLKRQIENVKTYLLHKAEPFEIISDIGSGINYNKPGLQKLIKMICSGEVKKVIVLYKDRLVRFGFELIEHIASINDCDIEVIDNTEKLEEQEVVEDLIQIITVFSCRLQGKRSSTTKKIISQLKEVDVSEKDIQS